MKKKTNKNIKVEKNGKSATAKIGKHDGAAVEKKANSLQLLLLFTCTSSSRFWLNGARRSPFPARRR